MGEGGWTHKSSLFVASENEFDARRQRERERELDLVACCL